MNAPARFAQCRTPADFYRVRIDIENTFTPREMHSLTGQSQTLAQTLHPWLASQRAMMRKRDGIVQSITCKAGEPVKTGQVVCLVVSAEDAAAADTA